MYYYYFKLNHNSNFQNQSNFWKRFFDYTINPLSTTGLLTPFLIGSYHELFTNLANHYKALKCSTTNLHMRLIFLSTSLIGSIYGGVNHLTNWQVVLMGLINAIKTDAEETYECELLL